MGQENLVVSYLQLRKAIGIIGCALPVVLPLGTMLYGMIYPDEYQSTLQSSISGYYYTAMRNYFVGSLCAIALFLFAYQYQGQDGERSPDNIAGNIELPPIFWTGSVDKFSALYLLKKGEYHGEKTDTSQRRIQGKSCSGCTAGTKNVGRIKPRLQVAIDANQRMEKRVTRWRSIGF